MSQRSSIRQSIRATIPSIYQLGTNRSPSRLAYANALNPFDSPYAYYPLTQLENLFRLTPILDMLTSYFQNLYRAAYPHSEPFPPRRKSLTSVPPVRLRLCRRGKEVRYTYITLDAFARFARLHASFSQRRRRASRYARASFRTSRASFRTSRYGRASFSRVTVSPALNIRLAVQVSCGILKNKLLMVVPIDYEKAYYTTLKSSCATITCKSRLRPNFSLNNISISSKRCWYSTSASSQEFSSGLEVSRSLEYSSRSSIYNLNTGYSHLNSRVNVFTSRHMHSYVASKANNMKSIVHKQNDDLNRSTVARETMANESNTRLVSLSCSERNYSESRYHVASKRASEDPVDEATLRNTTQDNLESRTFASPAAPTTLTSLTFRSLARFAALVVLSRDGIARGMEFSTDEYGRTKRIAKRSESSVSEASIKSESSVSEVSNVASYRRSSHSIFSLKDINELVRPLANNSHYAMAGIATLKSSFLHSQPLRITYSSSFTEVPIQVFNPLWGEPHLSIVLKTKGLLERYLSTNITHLFIFYVQNEQLISYFNVLVAACLSLLSFDVDKIQFMTDIHSNVLYEIDINHLKSVLTTENGTVICREQYHDAISNQSWHSESRNDVLHASEAMSNVDSASDSDITSYDSETTSDGDAVQSSTNNDRNKHKHKLSSLCCKSVTVLVIIGFAVLSLYNPESNVHTLVPT